MRALLIQHDHVSPPGPIGDRLEQRGYAVVPHLVVDSEHFGCPGVVSDFPDPTGFDAVVVMGAPWSVYDLDLVGTWVLPELDQLRAADEAGVPVLGICFGGQLLATAHGGSVTASSSPEVGWTRVDSDDGEIVPGGEWFQWHSDRWRLPPQARELARNEAASQAFVLRRNLAVQFHPELTTDALRGWLDNGGTHDARSRGLDPDELIAGTRAREHEASGRAHRLVDGFLDRVAVHAPSAGRVR